MDKKKVVLIIGGTGFIGKNLVNYFASKESYIVLSPNRHELNLLDDIECKNYLTNVGADLVIHSAVDINSTENSLKMFFNILNNRKYFKKMIQIGSGAEYDKRYFLPKMNEYKFGESIPIDTYGMSKYLISREINSLADNNIINIRLFGIFGKYENYFRRFISNNICNVILGEPISIQMDMYFDYIHVEDFLKLISIIEDKKLKYNNYNFCSGSPILLSTLAKLIKKNMDTDLPIIIKKPGLANEYSGNPKLLLDEIGGFSFAPIEDSIVKLISYYNNEVSPEKLNLIKKSFND